MCITITIIKLFNFDYKKVVIFVGLFVFLWYTNFELLLIKEIMAYGYAYDTS